MDVSWRGRNDDGGVMQRRFGVCYDFRNPKDSGLAMPDLYAQALDQIAWLDELGLDQVWFTEHHFVDDGYLPAWAPVAAAAAARTRRVRFSTDICLLPFSHPIRLAEDLAVLDNLSNGRVEIGLGHGLCASRIRRFWYTRFAACFFNGRRPGSFVPSIHRSNFLFPRQALPF